MNWVPENIYSIIRRSSERNSCRNIKNKERRTASYDFVNSHISIKNNIKMLKWGRNPNNSRLFCF